MKRFIFGLRSIRGLSITILLFIIAVIASVIGLNKADNSISQEECDLLRESMYSAAINCYAVNGRYPEYEELMTDYGIVIDTENYSVYYSSFASNIIPDIRVTRKVEVE